MTHGPLDPLLPPKQLLLQELTQGMFDLNTERPRAVPPVPGRVSLICPTMDERAMFHAQLYECFSEQRWPDKELVVIDTGTYPSPFLVLKAMVDNRLVYKHYRCMGTAWPVGLKRNLALELASGETIVHFDDDDLYAPTYVEHMMAKLGPADAITLSSWYVCDACTGAVAHVQPEETGSQESWVLGYGFSHVYRREVGIAHPFPNEHFGEDYRFFLALRDVHSRSVRTTRDEEGIVLHMQQGTNLSNSHGACDVASRVVATMPVAELPGFDSTLSLCCARKLASPFVSVGETYRMYLRPSPHQGEADMRHALRALGVPPAPCEGAWRKEVEGETYALATCCVWRRGECFVEPGRIFDAAKRFRDEAVLPGDVPRSTPAERLALLHLARMLLRRCPPDRDQALCFEGWLRLQLHSVSHIAVLALLGCIVQHFPGLRVEVGFLSAGAPEDPGAREREIVLRLLEERGLG